MRISIHFDDLKPFHNKQTYPVQNYCKTLVEQGIKGQLWIYCNQDKEHTYPPDCIYPSIKQTANHANARYWTNGQEYGIKDGELYGIKLEEDKENEG